AAARIVDEHVDRTRGIDHARHVGRGGDVRLHRLASDLGGNRTGPLSDEVRDDHRRTLCRETPRDRTPDPGASARDQRRPAFQTIHPLSAPSWRPRMYQRLTMMKSSRPGRIATTYIAAIVGQSHCPKPAFADAITTVSVRLSWSFVS